MARIGLVFGGRSVEHRVSVASARTVAAGLEQAGHEVLPLGIAEDGCWIDASGTMAALEGNVDALAAGGNPIAPTVGRLLEAGPEVVFPLVHGTWGEDGTLQGLCEMLDLPYVGAGVTASAVAMDKRLAKQVLGAAGLPQVEHLVISATAFERHRQECVKSASGLPAPHFVKPSVGGSSVGVQRVEDSAHLEGAIELALSFDDFALVERGVVGRELECAVLGDRELEASVVGEIVPGNPFYDYADKYLQDTAELIAPAELGPDVAARIQELATSAFAAIGGSGMARVDFLLEGDDGLFVNELNTLPGFTRISMYPRLWDLSGVPIPELVDRLVKIALARHQRRSRQLDVAIKEWLRTLDS